MNKAITEAYILGNLHAVRLCDANIPTCKLDQTFFYRCLSAVSQGCRPRSPIKDDNFRASVDLYRSWHPEGYSPPNSSHLSSGWFQCASQQMAVNASNSITSTLYRRFMKYLRLKHKLDGKEAYTVYKNTLVAEYIGDCELVKVYRARYPHLRGSAYEKDPHLAVPLFHAILRFFEGLPEQTTVEREVKGPKKKITSIQKRPRLFSILPLKGGFTCGHFKMCTNGLHGLLKRSGAEVPSSEKEFRDIADMHWRRLFNIFRYKTSTRKFAGEITTDGKAVSIVLRRKSKPHRKMDTGACERNYKQMWGLDPGRRDMITAVNQEGKKVKCSSREFHEEASYNRSNTKIKVLEDKDKILLEGIRNMPSCKTSNAKAIEKYIRYVLPRLSMLLGFYMTKNFRNMKFLRYVMARKYMEKLAKKITGIGGKN